MQIRVEKKGFILSHEKDTGKIKNLEDEEKNNIKQSLFCDNYYLSFDYPCKVKIRFFIISTTHFE